MRTLILSTSMLVGCLSLKDSDGDGLSDKEENELGTELDESDSDGDGLSDFDEVELGTDPTNEDSDGDGRIDGDEVDNDTDPQDANSYFYIGGWPVNPDKDSYDIPTSASTAMGAALMGYELMDQNGEMVNLYDFAGHGAPILIDISAIWCSPCNGLASWLSGGNDSYDFNSYWGNVPGMIENGDVYWITVLGQNDNGESPTLADLEGWYNDYPDPHIPILADDASQTFNNNYVMGGWPTLILFDENLNIISVPITEDADGDGYPDDFWRPMTDLNNLGN
jgi:thiol-disulfide isomerase/thioredoxin